MADEKLRALVQGMIDKGVPPDTIRTVIGEYKTINTPNKKPAPSTFADEPTTFASGVMNAMNPFGTGKQGGTALSAMDAGASGFVKGAINDLPSTLMGGLETVGGLISEPQETMEGLWEGIKSAPSAMMDTTMKAGSDPESFGRMMGQTTGQPLTTAGLSRVPIKPAIRGAGTPVAALGKFGAEHGYMVPGMFGPPIAKGLERLVGKGIQNIGERMKRVGTVEPELPPLPTVNEIPMGGPMPTPPPPQGMFGQPGARFQGQPSFTGSPTGEITPPGMIDLANPMQGMPVRQPIPSQRLLGPATELDFIQQALTKGEITPEAAVALTQQNTSRLAREAADYTSKGYTQNPTGVWERQPGVRDVSGRQVAPPQSTTQPRPMGPWDKNFDAANPKNGPEGTILTDKQTKLSPESKITAESFGPDFFKPDTKGVLTARLRTQFASPQVVEGLKAQGFKLVAVEGNKMVFKKFQ